ncbi:MAG: mechanosensitive ion channel domain-containing protein [Microcystaceae cyanobacterium]
MRNDLLWWVVTLILGFPILMIGLGEVSFFLEKRKSPQLELVQILRNLVVPTLAAFVIVQRILQLPHEGVFYRLIESLVFISLTYLALTSINQFLFSGAAKSSWRANVPKIFLDLSRTFLVLVGTAIILSTVWEADLAGLLTALGVGSLVIGLALQDSLGNIFSGITLLFEKPIAIGDWVKVGEVYGEVLEITWRSVHLYTFDKHLVIVPNSELAQGNFRNFSRPEPLHGISVELGFSCDDPPNKVIPLLKQTALETIEVLSKPEPTVLLSSYGDFAINYKTIFFVKDYIQGVRSEHDFKVRIWYASQRHNLTMPYPTSVQYEYESTASNEDTEKDKIVEILKTVPGWNLLSQEVLVQTYNKSKLITFSEGEIIIQTHQTLNEFYVIIEGKAEMSIIDKDHHHKVLSYLFKGDVLAEKSALLSGRISDTTITALEDIILLAIDIDTLQSLMKDYPLLATKIGELMELRRKQIH